MVRSFKKRVDNSSSYDIVLCMKTETLHGTPVATTAAEALVWQAEHHLANLEMARLTRSISKRELLRLESIANRAMEQCRLFTSVKDAQLMHCSRVVASL
jgi:hypothetical protein